MLYFVFCSIKDSIERINKIDFQIIVISGLGKKIGISDFFNRELIVSSSKRDSIFVLPSSVWYIIMPKVFTKI